MWLCLFIFLYTIFRYMTEVHQFYAFMDFHILFFFGGGSNNFEGMVHSCEMIQFVNFPGSAKYFWWGGNNF